MRPIRIAWIIAALLTIPAAAVALSQPDGVPEGPAAIQAHIRNELDAGFVRALVTDAEGREALDHIELLPGNGGWGIEVRLNPGSYHVEVRRMDGVWPFGTLLVNGGDVDTEDCPSSQVIVRFVTAFDGGEQRVAGPSIACVE